jgi:hypothetical protein
MMIRALSLVTLVLAVAAAGCGGSGRKHAATTTTTTTRQSDGPCRLSKAQRREVALALSDIRRLRKIEEPLHKFSDQGTPAQERVTGEFLVDIGRVKLPIDTRAHLMHLAKAAVGLCGLCFQGIEAEEPVLATKINGEQRCS